MGMTPDMFVNVYTNAEMAIGKAEELLAMTSGEQSPVKPLYSVICGELGNAESSLQKSIKGLNKDSKERRKYLELLKQVQELQKEFRNKELME